MSTNSTTSSPRRRRFTFGIAAGLALVLAGGGLAVASAHKSVDIDIDGTVQTIGTFAGSVEGALEAAGFEPAPHDEIVPDPLADLSDGDTITVRTAHQVEFHTDGEAVELWTTGRTAGDALADVASPARDFRMAASRSSDGRPEIALPLVTDGDVIFKVDGEEIRKAFTGTVPLAAALPRADITLGDKDEVVVTASDDGTPIVTITRISVEDETTTEVIKFTTETRKNTAKYKDQKSVIQQGKNGERTIVTRVTRVDGEVTEREEISNEVTTKARTHIIEVGTKTRPAPAPAPKTSSSGGGAPTSGVWAALARCESGGNPSIVSRNGLYHGLYQFTVSTWRSVGGSGLPSQASAAEQTKRAQILQARSGWGQWPGCARKLGLL